MNALQIDSVELSALATRVGNARRLQEDQFLLAAQAIVQAKCTLQTTCDFISAVECRASLEAAYVAFTALFPNHNFSTRKRAGTERLSERHYVSVWTDKGSHDARYYDASSLTLAFLRAVFGELAREMEQAARCSCPTCRSVGWYISEGGRKELCRHERTVEVVQ